MTKVFTVRGFLLGLTRQSKRRVMFGADLLAYAGIALFVSSFLYGARFSAQQFILIAAVALFTGLLVGWRMGIYNTVVRYIGLEFFHRANVTVAIAAIVTALSARPLGMSLDAVKWALMFWALMVLYICYSRYLSRSYLNQSKSRAQREKVVIYGAGAAGAQLAYYLQQNGLVLPVAFVDDEQSKHGTMVKGIEVFPPADLSSIVPDMGVSRILLAVPSASLRRRKEIIHSLEKLTAHIQTIPDFRDLVSGNARIDDIREIPLADLMGRPAVPPNPALLEACIKDKTVLVTGSGGSIGSELCHQIVKLGVRKLLLLDICEPSLYRVEKDLSRLVKDSQLGCEVVPLLGSVCDGKRMQSILEAYKVNTIYHAAAYKHVPMVEQNLLQGISNNSLGTFHLAMSACKAGVETFVLISTDKAVRPTSAMGASKRVAELVLQAIQKNCRTTRFCMVRFGNVLESSGSVVPLFREQIRRGGPVTVTHRDIVRYFMTIQEAAELVIQAGSMAEGGDVFVLDMGDPVKIRDLAQRMIMLAGFTLRDENNPEGDIEIQYTGLRPGEKLFEELLVGENASGTDHPRIMRAIESFIPFAELEVILGRLQAAVERQDCDEARTLLLEAVDSYKPEKLISDWVWQKSELRRPSITVEKITRISPYRENRNELPDSRNDRVDLN
jgi:FlaA1/EpsC-like NDP-sugar epimerase